MQTIELENPPEKRAPWSPRARTTLAYIAAIAVVLYVVRVLGAPWAAHLRIDGRLTDTFEYERIAHRGGLNPQLYFDRRAFIFPLFLWAMARNITLAIFVQTFAYALTFVWTIANALRLSRTRTAGVVAIVGFVAIAISSRFALWNALTLTETLAFVFAMISTGMWWRAAIERRPRQIFAACLWTVVWLMERDTNIVPTLFVALPVVLVWAWRASDASTRRACLRGALAIAAGCLFVFASSQVGHRADVAFNENVGWRVLNDPAFTKWFVSKGMPLDAALESRKGKVDADDNYFFERDPSLAKYRAWERRTGERWLAISSVTRFGYWYKNFSKNVPVVLHEDFSFQYDGYSVSSRMPKSLPLQLGGPRTSTGLVIWVALAVVGAGLAAADRRTRLAAVLVVVGIASVAIDMYYSFVGEPMETSRHQIGAVFRLSLLIVIGVVLGVDAVVQRVAAKRHGDAG